MILVTYGGYNIFCDTIEKVKKAIKIAKSYGEYPELFRVSEIPLDEVEAMFAPAENDNG